MKKRKRTYKKPVIERKKIAVSFLNRNRFFDSFDLFNGSDIDGRLLASGCGGCCTQAKQM